MSYLVRVGLPDRPGALGAVASRIGSVGGDVVSIEILERVRGQVVDEIGVVLARDGLVDLLRDEILEVDGVAVESLRRIEGQLPDRHAELLDVATDLFGQPSTQALLDRLTERARASLGARFAAVLDRPGLAVVAGRGEHFDRPRLEAAARRAAAGPGPGAVPGPGPVAVPGPGPMEGDDGVAAAHLVQADLVLVVGRPRPVFRERERRWVAILAGIADHGWRDLA